jgi:hypothetical protein
MYSMHTICIPRKKGTANISLPLMISLVRPERFELPTHGLGICYASSIFETILLGLPLICPILCSCAQCKTARFMRVFFQPTKKARLKARLKKGHCLPSSSRLFTTYNLFLGITKASPDQLLSCTFFTPVGSPSSRKSLIVFADALFIILIYSTGHVFFPSAA